MNTDELKREAKYQATMCIAKKMLSQGLLNEIEYRQVNKIFQKKYHPILGTLFSSLMDISPAK